MALIRTLDPKEIARPSLHREIQASVAVFESDGKKVVQIDSYGRSDRMNPGKISQTLQFDEQSARQLLSILRREFEG